MSRLPPTAAVRRAYQAIEVWDDPATFIYLPPIEDALRRAEAVEAKGGDLPLAGLVFAVKDNIDVAGMPTTAACPAFSHMAERSAFVVEKLEAAGAIVIGKSNVPLYSLDLQTFNEVFGHSARRRASVTLHRRGTVCLRPRVAGARRQ